MHPLPEPNSSLGGTNPDLEKALNPQQERTSKKHLLCNVLLFSGMAYVSAIREHKTIGSACLCKVNIFQHISIHPQAFVILYRVLTSTKAMWLTLKVNV